MSVHPIASLFHVLPATSLWTKRPSVNMEDDKIEPPLGFSVVDDYRLQCIAFLLGGVSSNLILSIRP